MKNVRLVRKDENAVSPVIATILMVAITVVLAAVLYVMVSGLLTGPGATRPVVTFGATTGITNGFQFSVAAASQNVNGPANYKVNLQVNSTTGTSVALGLSMTLVVPAPVSATYTIAWLDPGGERTLNGGDTFQITRTGGVQTQTTYTFYLLWNDGTSIQQNVHTIS